MNNECALYLLLYWLSGLWTNILLYWLSDLWANLPNFCWRHFKIPILEWKYGNSNTFAMEFVPMFVIDDMSARVQVVASLLFNANIDKDTECICASSGLALNNNLATYNSKNNRIIISLVFIYSCFRIELYFDYILYSITWSVELISIIVQKLNMINFLGNYIKKIP